MKTRLDEYIKITLESQSIDGKKTIEFDAPLDTTWMVLLDEFTNMLRGAGYTIDGSFELVDDYPESTEQVPE